MKTCKADFLHLFSGTFETRPAMLSLLKREKFCTYFTKTFRTQQMKNIKGAIHAKKYSISNKM